MSIGTTILLYNYNSFCLNRLEQRMGLVFTARSWMHSIRLRAMGSHRKPFPPFPRTSKSDCAQRRRMR